MVAPTMIQLRAALVPALLTTLLPAQEGDQDKALIAKARAIHKRVLTLDTHKDIEPTLALDPQGETAAAREAFARRTDPTVDGSNQVDFPKARAGGLKAAFWIVYVGQGALNGGGYINAKRAAMLKFDAIHRMCKKYPEHIGLATSPAQVRELDKQGKLIACIGIENGYPMGLDLKNIERFYKLGARYMSIAHNRHSQLGDSHTPDEPLHGGLSELGRKAIAEMNRLGIMVDISHAAKSTMLQALKLSKAPVLASHSGCRALRDVSRNLDDEQLQALKENGGVIQCVALESFVGDTGPRRAALAKLRKELGLPGRRELARMRREGELSAEVQKQLETFDQRVKAEVDPKHPAIGVSQFVDHIDHAVKVMGIDHVAISSDFDGGGGVEGWRDASETFNVTLELVRRGYTEEQIGKIWSGNTLRLWEEVEAVARRIQGGGK